MAFLNALLALVSALGILTVLCWHGLIDPRRSFFRPPVNSSINVPLLRIVQIVAGFGMTLAMDRISRWVMPAVEPNWVLCTLSGFPVAYIVTQLLTERAARKAA